MAVLKSSFEAAMERFGISINPITGRAEYLGPASLTPSQYLRRDVIAKNLYETHLALKSSNFGKKHGIIKGENLTGFILGRPGQSFGRNVSQEKSNLSMQRIAHSIPDRRLLPAVINNPLKNYLAGFIAQRKNRFDNVGHRGISNKYNPLGEWNGTTALTIPGQNASSLLGAFMFRAATKSPFENAGIGAVDDILADKLYDTNFAYNGIRDDTPEWARMYPVPKDIGDAFVREDEKKKKEREEIDSRNRRANYKTAQRRYESAKEFPMWKAYFRDSKNSAKDIRHMDKLLTNISKIPLVGRFVHATPLGVSASALTMLASMIYTFMRKEESSSVAGAKFENVAGIWGKPTKEFANAARRAGLKGAEIDEAWAKFQRMGGASVLQGTIGGMKPGMERGFMAEAFGLNANDVRILDELEGIGSSKSRKFMTAVNAAEIISQYGMSAGMPKSARNLSQWFSIPLIGGWLKSIETRINPEGMKFWAEMIEATIREQPYRDIKEAAESADDFNRNGSPSSTSNETNNNQKSISFNVSQIEIKTDNVKGLATGLAKYADSVIGDRMLIADSFDTEIVA